MVCYLASQCFSDRAGPHSKHLTLNKLQLELATIFLDPVYPLTLDVKSHDHVQLKVRS